MGSLKWFNFSSLQTGEMSLRVAVSWILFLLFYYFDTVLIFCRSMVSPSVEVCSAMLFLAVCKASVEIESMFCLVTSLREGKTSIVWTEQLT